MQTTSARGLSGEPLLGVDVEIGVHSPAAERLLNTLGTQCESDIMSELGELLMPPRDTEQRMSELSGVDGAVGALVELVDAHAFGFACAHASVDAVLVFIAQDRMSRTGDFEAMFVPALLAASVPAAGRRPRQVAPSPASASGAGDGSRPTSGSSLLIA